MKCKLKRLKIYKAYRVIFMFALILINVYAIFGCNKIVFESDNNKSTNEMQEETKVTEISNNTLKENTNKNKNQDLKDFDKLSKREQLKEILLLREGCTDRKDECVGVLLSSHEYKYKEIAKDFYEKNENKVKFDFEITNYYTENEPYRTNKALFIESNKQIKKIDVIYEVENDILVGIKDITFKNLTDVDGKVYRLMYDDIEIFNRLIKRNSNWDGLPLTNEFLNKYNSIEGIFKDIDFKDFEINKNGLTSYLEHCVDVNINIGNDIKRFLIKYEVVENNEYRFHDIHNYFKINDIRIISADNPAMILNHELSKEKYNSLNDKGDYEKAIKTFIYYRYYNESEIDEPYECIIGKNDITEDYSNSFSEEFKNKYFDGTIIVRDRLFENTVELDKHCGYLGCNLEKQLVFLHYNFWPNNSQDSLGNKELFYYSLDENGLIQDFYCIDKENTKYNNIGLRNLFTDTSYRQGFLDLFNKKPDEDVIYVDRFNYALTDSMEGKYEIYDLLPNLRDSDCVKIVDEIGFESDYYKKELYVDVYFNDYVVRYKIKFELDDYLKLDNIEYDETR